MSDKGERDDVTADAARVADGSASHAPELERGSGAPRAERVSKEASRLGAKVPLLQSLMRGVIETGADVLGSTLGQELRRELEARGVSTGGLIKRTLEQGVSKGAEVLDQTEELRRSLSMNPSELVERVTHKVDSYKAEGVEIARAELSSHVIVVW